MVAIENPPANAGGEGDPWCGKIPHATRQLTCAPQLLSPRSAARAATARCNQRGPVQRPRPPTAKLALESLPLGKPAVKTETQSGCVSSGSGWVSGPGACREGPAGGETPAGWGVELGRKCVPEERLRGSEPGWGAADAGVRGKVGDGGYVPAEKGPPRPTPGKPTQEGLQVPAGLPVRFGRRS